MKIQPNVCIPFMIYDSAYGLAWPHLHAIQSCLLMRSFLHFGGLNEARHWKKWRIHVRLIKCHASKSEYSYPNSLWVAPLSFNLNDSFYWTIFVAKNILSAYEKLDHKLPQMCKLLWMKLPRWTCTHNLRSMSMKRSNNCALDTKSRWNPITYTNQLWWLLENSMNDYVLFEMLSIQFILGAGHLISDSFNRSINPNHGAPIYFLIPVIISY